MSGPVVQATDATFKAEVLDSKVPTLVDFWAPWCSPCKMLAPIIEEVAQEFQGRAKFVKVNTDDSIDAATRYNIRSIPTVLLFKNGEVLGNIVGLRPKRDFVDLLEKNL